MIYKVMARDEQKRETHILHVSAKNVPEARELVENTNPSGMAVKDVRLISPMHSDIYTVEIYRNCS